MVKNKMDNNPNAFDTLIGKNTVITGKIESSGLTRIEGKVVGDIILEGNLIIGQDSHVQGNIKAINIEIYGKVIGDVDVEDALTLHETATLQGNANIKTFIVKGNAAFDGNCKMKNTINTKSKENNDAEKKNKNKK